MRVTPAFVASRAEAGACVFDAQEPSLAGEARPPCRRRRAARGVFGLRRVVAENAFARRGGPRSHGDGSPPRARRHGGRSHRMEEAGYAHV